MARKQYSEEEIQKRIESLPEAAGDYLYSAEMAQEVKEIADKHHLHIDQMSLLEAETGEVMLGLTDTADFVPNLIETLQIDQEKATAIAKDINEQIVSKIRASMGQPSSASASVAMPSAPKPPVPAPSPAMPQPKPMPVSTPMTASSTPAPVQPMPAPAPVKTPAPAPVPKPVPNLTSVEAMLEEKKVSVPAPAAPAPAPSPAVQSAAAALIANQAPAKAPEAPTASPAQAKPQDYKADPYREPIE